jgi:1-aminocyclopropane-1-carboxylate deaminase
MISYSETPIQEISHPIFEKAGIRLLVKREDLNHPLISGNKWWKLKYNLSEAVHRESKTILTFGGAYSNHIFSTAAAVKEIGLKCIGVIRGERIEPLNYTLAFAEKSGMQLKFVNREDYRKKNEGNFIASLREQYGDFFLIPEGGTNDLAMKGCEEFTREKLSQLSFDTLMLPVGTGGTIAGIISAFEGSKEVIGVSVLKNGEFLNTDIKNLLAKYSAKDYGTWSVLTSYDHGGYAKVTKELLDLVRAMNQKHNLPLDTVYTAKLIWAALREIERGRFPRGTTVLALHTGGLQGKYTSPHSR